MSRYVTQQDFIYNDGSVQTLRFEETASSSYDLLVRFPHDTERFDFDGGDLRYIPNLSAEEQARATPHVRRDVRVKKGALPEVYRFDPDHSTLLTSPLQHLWYGINPELSVNKWWTLVDRKLAFTNMGAGNSPNDPKANYVAGTNLSRKPPAFDQARVTGGHTARAKKVGNRVYIETIIVKKPYPKPLPTPEELLADERLWYWATSISPTGRIQYFHRMGKDGKLKRVRIPLFTVEEVSLPASEVHVLTDGQIIENHKIVYSK